MDERRTARGQRRHRVRFDPDPLEVGRKIGGGDVVATGSHGRTLSARRRGGPCDERDRREGTLEDLGEAGLERGGDLVADGALGEAFDQRLEEAFDHQGLRVGLVEAARGEVEELLLVDLGDRRGVGAADVVGEDLEAGDRVGVRLGESSRLRLSWKASVCWAPGSTLIIPRQTAVEPLARTPRKARSELVFGAACSCVVS